MAWDVRKINKSNDKKSFKDWQIIPKCIIIFLKIKPHLQWNKPLKSKSTFDLEVGAPRTVMGWGTLRNKNLRKQINLSLYDFNWPV